MLSVKVCNGWPWMAAGIYYLVTLWLLRKLQSWLLALLTAPRRAACSVLAVPFILPCSQVARWRPQGRIALINWLIPVHSEWWINCEESIYSWPIACRLACFLALPFSHLTPRTLHFTRSQSWCRVGGLSCVTLHQPIKRIVSIGCVFYDFPEKFGDLLRSTRGPFRNGHEKEREKLETGVATPTIWVAYSN